MSFRISRVSVPILGLLRVQAHPRVMRDAVLRRALRLEVDEPLEVVDERLRARTVVAGPERGLRDGDAAAHRHRAVVVGRARDHVRVQVDVLHVTPRSRVRRTRSCDPATRATSCRGSLKAICTRRTRSPRAVDEDLERRAHRAHAEVVLGVELSSALEAVEERGQIEDLHAVVHEPALDELALRQRARGGVLGHAVMHLPSALVTQQRRGLQHEVLVELVHVERRPDAVDQRDRQPSAEVLAELLEAVEQRRARRPRRARHRGVPDRQPDAFEHLEHAPQILRVQYTGEAGVGAVLGEADGDGLAVAQLVARQRLELVRRPVAEVQRPRGAELERVAARRDVGEVKLGAAIHELLHGGRRAPAQGDRVRLDPREERGVADQRDLDRLRDPRAPVAIGQRLEEVEVVEHRVRRGERPDEVLLAEAVDAVLDADGRVALRQDRARHADQPDPAVRGGRRVADRVEHRAATDRDDVGVAVDAMGVDRGADRVDRPAIVLDRLSAGHDDRRRDELESSRRARGSTPAHRTAIAGCAAERAPRRGRRAPWRERRRRRAALCCPGPGSRA